MHTDTLIIGAGLAGLALADGLKRSGHNCLIAEARHRPGGRILTRRVYGVDLDLGPAWFWPGQPRMAAMAERFEIPAFEQAWLGDSLFEQTGGGIQRGAVQAGMRGALRLDGGMGRLSDALADGQEDALLLSSPVTKLTLVDQTIQIEMAGSNGVRSVSTNRVILAVPPRLARNLPFHPPLPEKALTALAAIPTWMAGQAKIVAVYDRPHWRDQGLSGDAFSQVGPMVEIHDASTCDGEGHALFGFVGVPPETRLAHKGQLKELARVQLERLFGPDMAQPLQLILQDWAGEPETATPADHRGLTQHPQYGCPAPLSGLWDGRLLFGSSEMASEFGGYLEGALEVADTLCHHILQAER